MISSQARPALLGGKPTFFLPYKYVVKTIACIISCQIDSYRAKSDYPMPKQVTENELQRIEDVLLRFPAGLSLVELRNELSGSISRRTLSRRISDLLVAGRIHRRGEGRARGIQPRPALRLSATAKAAPSSRARQTTVAAAPTGARSSDRASSAVVAAPPDYPSRSAGSAG